MPRSCRPTVSDVATFGLRSSSVACSQPKTSVCKTWKRCVSTCAASSESYPANRRPHHHTTQQLHCPTAQSRLDAEGLRTRARHGSRPPSAFLCMLPTWEQHVDGIRPRKPVRFCCRFSFDSNKCVHMFNSPFSFVQNTIGGSATNEIKWNKLASDVCEYSSFRNRPSIIRLRFVSWNRNTSLMLIKRDTHTGKKCKQNVCIISWTLQSFVCHGKSGLMSTSFKWSAIRDASTTLIFGRRRTERRSMSSS